MTARYSKSSGWLLLFFALAGIDLMSVGATFYGNRRHIDDDTRVLESNAAILRVLQASEELLTSADHQIALANNSFASPLAAGEGSKNMPQTRDFTATLAVIRDLTENEALGAAWLPPDVINAIGRSIVAVHETTMKMMGRLNRGDSERPVDEAVALGASYADLVRAIARLRSAAVDKQAAVLDDYGRSLARARVAEALVAALLFLAVLAIVAYGVRMAYFLEASAHREANLEEKNIILGQLEEAQRIAKIGRG